MRREFLSYDVFIDGSVVDIDLSAEDAELDSVSIKPPLQGKGYGRTFVRFLTDRILEKDEGEPILWCVVGNNKARALYDSLGYRELYREDFAEKRFGK